MNGESLISENVMSEDHLDAMFTILNELKTEVKEDEKKKCGSVNGIMFTETWYSLNKRE